MRVHLSELRAFPGKVDTGFPKENAPSIESRALSGHSPSDFMVSLIGKRSNAMAPIDRCRQDGGASDMPTTDREKPGSNMQGVTVVDHPLVQHKLTLMRDRNRSTKAFRQLLNEIGTLLCYEVTRDLPIEDIDIETPMGPTRAPVLAGKKLVFAPILRAGIGFLDGMLDLVPSARVAHIGLYRDPKTLVA